MTHISAHQLITEILDPDTFRSWGAPPHYTNISTEYQQALHRAREKSGVDEAVVTGEGQVFGTRVAFVLSEFRFLGGSIGAATARRIIDAIHRATAEKLPLLISPASGGTRMQEGTPAFALMVSITTAVYRHKDAHLPFLVYLRNPTTGGVFASWGSAGHLTFAEPNALLGFLGPRVVELTTGTTIPEGVQRGEHLAHQGVIDGVISPRQLRMAVRKITNVLLTPSATSKPPLSPVEQTPKQHAWDSILATRRADRPGLREFLAALGSDNVIELSGTDDGHTSPAIKVVLARIADQPVVIIGQDRRHQPPHASTELGPAALRFARRGIALAHSLQIPLVSIIDTPGAELSAAAEEQGLARSIARTLGELVDVDVPTVSVILGQGCGGGALAMLPEDKVLAAACGWLSPLPPEGASAIIYRDTTHAPEMMEAQGVSAAALLATGIIDEVIPELPSADVEPVAFISRVIEHIGYSLWELENAPQRLGREQRFRHYERLADVLG